MGIALNSNFTINVGLPIDDRLVVADLTARDAIIIGRRYEGLTVYVVSESSEFQLQGGVADTDWRNLGGTLGGEYWSRETSTVVTSDGTLAGLEVTGLTIGSRYKVTVTARCVRDTTTISELQTIDFSAVPDEGDFKVDYAGAQSATLGWDASAAEIQTALNAIPALSPNSFTVSGSMATGFVLLENSGGGNNLSQVTVVASSLKSTGIGGNNETQRVQYAGAVDGGTFTITFDGQTTGAIAWNASAATVKSALEALPNINEVTVTDI